ncbi:MAG: hypothetical protein ACJ72A_08435 [Nocardioidaceae bacterium]
MGDEPTEDTSKLELPSLKLPALGRRRKRSAPEPASDVAPQDSPAVRPAPAEPEPAGPEPAGAAKAARPFSRRFARPTMPSVSARVAATLTGLAVGVGGALLTYASLRGCEAVRGAESCGGAGVPILAVILALMVLAGGLILTAWGLAEARGTSFLGVGLLCVLMLLTLIEELFSAWMFLVVPLVSAGSYLLAHWVTTAIVEPRPERGPQHDIR